MDPSYALEYRELYQRHWWWRSRERYILRELRQCFGDTDRSRKREILDVGCGDGLFFDQLQHFGNVTGVEGDPNTMTSDGRWAENIHCQWFDDRFHPGRSFDAILMLDILEHMSDPQAALRHAHSLMDDDGILIATVPAFMSLWTSHDDLNHHEIRYTRREFESLLASGGFQVMAASYLFHWTCPVKMAIRIKEWIFGANPRNPSVPAPWLNSLCYGLSRLEQETISRWGMPFGSSLMVVAGKQSRDSLPMLSRKC